METLFKLTQLPLKELESLGLYQQGNLKMDRMDLAALLAGRRTDFITFTDLKAEGVQIQSLDAKLSLERADDGSVALRLHPVHHRVREHELIADWQMNLLTSRQSAVVLVEAPAQADRIGLLAIEYDFQTREFISYDPAQVQVPDQINGFSLSEQQKRDFRKGSLIQLPDGIRVQHRAAEPSGVSSDTPALIFSVKAADGLAYLPLEGVKSIIASGFANRLYVTPAYTETYNEMNLKLSSTQSDLPPSYGPQQIDESQSADKSQKQGRGR